MRPISSIIRDYVTYRQVLCCIQVFSAKKAPLLRPTFKDLIGMFDRETGTHFGVFLIDVLLQHRLANAFQVSSRSVGHEPYRRVVIAGEVMISAAVRPGTSFTPACGKMTCFSRSTRCGS